MRPGRFSVGGGRQPRANVTKRYTNELQEGLHRMGETRLEQLDGPARDLAERSLAWMDRCWDEAAGLFRMPDDILYEAGRLGVPGHLVRETGWYALGLLLRDAPGDRERAFRAIDTLLGHQYDAPGRVYHGTWRRSPAEPPPLEQPTLWRDYDPNWREFIGTTLALILIEYEARLPAELVTRIDAALRRAMAGAFARDVPAAYTNIALMSAFLLQFGAERFGEPAWRERAEQLATEIRDRFRVNGTFDEYNSPTYYGTDLYGLALWRAHAFSPLLREAGAELEAAFWRDIAQFYHAGMRNLAGPYDRSYGMDMRRYVACLGLWIWLATGYERAPVPDLGRPFGQGWDLGTGPTYALLGLRMPDDAKPHFLAFQGERLLQRPIVAEPRRVATAWVGAHVMIGGQDSSSSFRVGDAQFHPATIHWIAGEGRLGWIRTRSAAPVDAWAERDQLTIISSMHQGGDLEFVFQIAAPEVSIERLTPARWELPGLIVRLETNAEGPAISRNGELVELRYRAPGSRPGAPIRFMLRTERP